MRRLVEISVLFTMVLFFRLWIQLSTRALEPLAALLLAQKWKRFAAFGALERVLYLCTAFKVSARMRL